MDDIWQIGRKVELDTGNDVLGNMCRLLPKSVCIKVFMPYHFFSTEFVNYIIV